MDIFDNLNKIRRLIGDPWKLGVILKDPKAIHRIYASIDVVEDSQNAINQYKDLPNFIGKSGGFLHLYGLLQATFMQQDATVHLLKSLCDIDINYEIDYPNIWQIRELRNDAIGHPTDRRKGKSFHYVAGLSICNNSFDIASYREENNFVFDLKTIDVDILIKTQQGVISSLINQAAEKTELDIKTHKMKFMNDKTQDKLPDCYNSEISRLYNVTEGRYKGSDDQEAKHIIYMATSFISTILGNIKDAVVQRYGGYDTIAGIKLAFAEIDYIFGRIEKWSGENCLHDNKDASVFVYALIGKFKELSKILEDIDREFDVKSE